jgi:Xaa-Pro aminopeptidase
VLYPRAAGDDRDQPRALSQGAAGRDLDALARYPLWLAGQDYDHGTGHGVGAFLSCMKGRSGSAACPRCRWNPA